jgi:predicted component of type VI protein secretion system
MGSEGRRSLPDLSAELGARPGRFDFAQAVRAAEDASPALAPVGEDDSPADEAVRFTVARSLVFAAAPLRATRRAEWPARVRDDLPRPDGPQWRAPAALHRTRDPAHATPRPGARVVPRPVAPPHAVALRARLGEIPRRVVARARVAPARGPRPVRACVALPRGPQLDWRFARRRSARGRPGPRPSRARRVRRRRSSSCSTAFLGLEVHVVPFVGRWVEIPASERSRLPTRANPGGSNAALGGGAVLGRRYWDVASRIRVELGPMTRERFLELRPDGPLFADLRHVARGILRRTARFRHRAHARARGAPRDAARALRSGRAALGWNTRLSARGPDQAQQRVLFSLASS